MKLGELLTAELIRLDFAAPDKRTAIERLTAFCVERGAIPADRQARVVQALMAREAIDTTGLGHGVALPHATVDYLEAPAAAVAISPQGVPFDAKDGRPAQILLLLVVPRRQIERHVRTLAAAARLLESEAMRKALCAAVDRTEVLAIIRREEHAHAS